MDDFRTPLLPGQMRLEEVSANPAGAAGAQLFLLKGDAVGEPVREIVPSAIVQQLSRPPELGAHPFYLKIIHINDLHGHIAEFMPYGERPIFSKIVWYLRHVRRQAAEAPVAAVLALSAGDDLVGSVFDELLGEDPESYTAHPAYRLYSAAGFDACGLGNHDLDLGVHVLAHAIRRDALFPVLSANLSGSPVLAEATAPAAIFVIQGVRVGVIGLSTAAQLKEELAADHLQVVHPVHVLQNLLPAMKPLCDVLILLSHLGYSMESTSASVIDAGDMEVARQLPYGALHLIIGGHTHHVLNEQGLSAHNIVNGIPIAQAGTLGRHLGEIDLVIRHGWAAVTNARLVPTARLPADEEFERKHVAPLLAVARNLFDRPLGPTANHPDLTTFAVRNTFAAGESALANFIADALVESCRSLGYPVDLAAIDASSVRCGLPVGQVLVFGDWFNLMPFADTVRILTVTGADLLAMIQDNALRVDRPGEPHTERGFVHFSRQVRYTIELGQERSQARATNITFDGQPIETQLARTFRVACSSFVRRPAAEWETFAARQLGLRLMGSQQIPHQDTGLFLRDVLVSYIRAHGGVTEEAGARRDGRLIVMEKGNHADAE